MFILRLQERVIISQLVEVTVSTKITISILHIYKCYNLFIIIITYFFDNHYNDVSFNYHTLHFTENNFHPGKISLIIIIMQLTIGSCCDTSASIQGYNYAAELLES